MGGANCSRTGRRVLPRTAASPSGARRSTWWWPTTSLLQTGFRPLWADDRRSGGPAPGLGGLAVEEIQDGVLDRALGRELAEGRPVGQAAEGSADRDPGPVAVDQTRVDVGRAAHRWRVAQVVGHLLEDPADGPLARRRAAGLLGDGEGDGGQHG